MLALVGIPLEGPSLMASETSALYVHPYLLNPCRTLAVAYRDRMIGNMFKPARLLWLHGLAKRLGVA